MDKNDKYWGRERGHGMVDTAQKESPMVINTDYWFMGRVKERVIFLWQGEQVDGSMFAWGPEHEDLGTYPDVLEMPAVGSYGGVSVSHLTQIHS